MSRLEMDLAAGRDYTAGAVVIQEAAVSETRNLGEPADAERLEDEGGTPGQLPIAERIAVVRFESGDVAVLRHPGRLTVEQAERIRRQLRAALPGVRVLVLEEGAELSVLRPVPEVEMLSREELVVMASGGSPDDLMRELAEDLAEKKHVLPGQSDEDFRRLHLGTWER